MIARPDVAALKAYLGPLATGKTDQVLQSALSAETSAQAARCRVPVDPAAFPDDLAEALCRRVARNLAMRNLPLGVQVDEMTSTRIGSSDPEVRRLEAPYRKLVVG